MPKGKVWATSQDQCAFLASWSNTYNTLTQSGSRHDLSAFWTELFAAWEQQFGWSPQDDESSSGHPSLKTVCVFSSSLLQL